MLLVVNYHYVDMPPEPHAGVSSMESAQLLEQIRWLRERFVLVTIRDLLTQLKKGRWPDEPQCLITFDDGLRCHYDRVFPLLQENNIPAVFFVSGRPLAEHRGTEIHKSHVARARLGDTLVRESFLGFLKRKAIDKEAFLAIPEEEIRSHYRYDPISIARFKYWTNYVLPTNLRGEFWDDLILELYEKESDFCEEWYLNEAMVYAMHDASECVGSHAWSHNPLAPMDATLALNEMQRSHELLGQITGRKIHAISYPLGNAKAVGQRESVLAEQAGYRLGLTMERAVNIGTKDPTLMARVDCNDLPDVGKLPLFEWTTTGLQRLDGLPVHRRSETQAYS